MKKIFITVILVTNIFSQTSKMLTYNELKIFNAYFPSSDIWNSNNIFLPSVNSFNNENNFFFSFYKNKGEKYNYSLRLDLQSSSFSYYQLYQNKLQLYNVSTGFGDKDFSFGVGYTFWKGEKQLYQKENFYTLSTTLRPLKYFSVSYGINSTFKDKNNSSYGEVGIRPFGNDILSVFADGEIYKSDKSWSYGISSNLIQGMTFYASYNSKHYVSLGLSLQLNNLGIFSSYASHSGDNITSNSIRLGTYHSNKIIQYIEKETVNKYYKYELNRNINYQRYQFFDNSYTLLGLLKEFEAIKNDISIKGIVINTSAMYANREMIWELREKLKELKDNGKKIIIYIDNANIDIYYFATVADKIVMDPQGMLSITGFVTGRSYYKNMLDKIGLGFDELRFFEYKSAVETISRTRHSTADSIQRFRMIEVFYETYKKDICAARNIKTEQWDTLVNKYIYYLPKLALENNLVDVIARWSELQDNKELFEEKPTIGKFFLTKEDNQWSKKKKIAIVYAIGACAMDEGITARRLVNDMKQVMTDDDIVAVILRVDSPGGDPLASDLIAEIIRKYKDKKPVVISQGMVAASGGYWLSMYGTKIVASPLTITGSIGVISGWVYDNGIKDKLGITTSKVQIGKFADMGYPFILPILPIGIPDRKLTQEERKQMEEGIKIMYKDFVDKVAKGRNLKFDEVEPNAQGRIWMGEDAKNIKLVDEIGSLQFSINLAKKLSKISDDEEIVLIEFPKPGLFNFQISELLGIKSYITNNHIVNYFKDIQYPKAVLPLDLYLEYYQTSGL